MLCFGLFLYIQRQVVSDLPIPLHHLPLLFLTLRSRAIYWFPFLRLHPSRLPFRVGVVHSHVTFARWTVDALAREMIEVVLNDRLGRKVRVKCNPDDTVGDLKKLVAAQTGTRPERIRIQKWYTVYKDHITLADYEIHDGMGLELYYD